MKRTPVFFLFGTLKRLLNPDRHLLFGRASRAAQLPRSAFRFAFIKLTFVALLAWAGVSTYGATVTTDQADYPPGSTVQITGAGFAPGETVQLQVANLTNPSEDTEYPEYQPWQVVADANGNFTATWTVTENEANMMLQLAATGLSSGLTAHTTFTDASVLTVSGTVQFPSGTGIVDATVTGYTTSSLTTVDASTTSALDGTWTLSLAKNATRWVVVTPPAGYTSLSAVLGTGSGGGSGVMVIGNNEIEVSSGNSGGTVAGNQFIMAGIAQRGSATTGDVSTGTTLTINKPTGVVAGDVMIVNIQLRGGSKSLANFSGSPGWTSINSVDFEGHGADHRCALLYRVAGSSESSSNSYTFTIDNQNVDGAAGAIVAFSGVNSSSPFDVTPGSFTTGSGTSISGVTATTTADANAAVLMFAATFENTTLASFSTTSPGALTALYGSPALADGGVGAGWGTMAIAGSTGAGTATVGANKNWAAILIALKPIPPDNMIVTLPGQTFTSGSGNSGTVSAQTAGTPFNVTLTLVDTGNNTLTSYSGTKTISYSGPASSPGGNAPVYTTSVTFNNGQATGVAMTLYDAQTTTITATDGTYPGIASSSLTVNGTGTASTLAFAVEPSTTTASSAISPAVVVNVGDQYGNPVSGDSSSVTIGSTTTGFTGSTLSANAVNGVATFSAIKPTTVGTANTLTASDSSLAGATSSTFTVSAAASGSGIAERGTATTATGTASTLTIAKPSGVVAGDVMVVNIQLRGGSKSLANFSGSPGWTSINSVDFEGGGADHRCALLYRVAGSSESSSNNYTFTIDNQSVDGAGGAIVAFSGVDTTSGPFDVTPGTFTTGTANPISGVTAITTASANAAVLMFAATFENISITSFSTTSPGALTNLYNTDSSGSVGAGWATKAVAGSTGTGSATLSGSHDWAAILLALKPLPSVGPGTNLVFTTMPADTTAGSTMASVVVQVEDQYGNSIASNNVPITMTLNSGSFTGGSTTTVNTDSSGNATFNNLAINTVGNYTMTATAISKSSATSVSFNVTVGTASKLAFGVQPTTTTTNYPITPAVTVMVQDQYGNTVTTDNSTVTIAGTATSFTGDSTLSVAAVNGVATFSNLRPTTASTNTLTAGDSENGGLTGATSSAFKVNRPPAPGLQYLTTKLNTALHVSVSTLASLNYDADGDTLTITAVSSASTNGPSGNVTLSGGNVNYTPATGYVGADQFTYTISDGYTGGTATSTNKVTVTLGKATSVFNYISGDSGDVSLRGYGIPGNQYDIQRSDTADFTSYTTLTTITVPANGLILYTNIEAASPSYYRFAVH